MVNYLITVINIIMATTAMISDVEDINGFPKPD